ncbi:MAG: ABC transporter permease [Oscillospiraceae bacterium]|nr:ABC transporter permease [Oscillospiraceae bacterium]
MTVFKTYMKVLLKNKIVVGINFVIFLAIAVLMSRNPVVTDNILEFVNVGIIYNYENTKNDGLVRHLSETFNVVDIEDDSVTIKTALFYDEVHYVIIINEDGFQSYQVPNSSVGHLVESSINNYLNTFALIQSAGTTTDENEIVNQTIENINLTTNVILEYDDGTIGYLGIYFNMFVYGGLGSIVMGIGVAMIAFNRKTVYERTVVSSTKLTRRNIHLSFSSLVFSLMVWVVTVLVAIVITGADIQDGIVQLFILNSFIFTIVCCSLGFLISQLLKKMVVLSAVISVLGLVLGFISGAFVPQFLLGDLTIAIAQFTPAYWFVLVNDLIVDMGTITLEPLVNGILIQIGFAVAFSALALAVSKYKMEKK